MNYLIWLVLFIIIAIPFGIVALKLSKKIQNFDLSSTVLVSAIKAMIVIVIGGVALLYRLSDTQLIWVFGFLLIFSLTVDFFIADRPALTITGTVSFFVLLVLLGATCFVGGVNNAVAFDELVIYEDGFPIQSEIPDNELRLTTKELAESIASQHMGEFGSSTQIIGSDIGRINGTLYWIVGISKQEDFDLKRKTAGFVLIDANDPGKPVITQKIEINFAEGLDYFPLFGAHGNAQASSYFGIGTNYCYGETYPIVDSNGIWSIAQTKFELDPWFVRHYSGVFQMDKTGTLINEYHSNFPSQMIKIYDEDNFLEAGIRDWGFYRKEDGFDILAGGFLGQAPSNDRLEITEDTRYIYDSGTDDISAMIMMNSIRENGKLSLAGAFKANSSGIYYYDLKDFNFMSGFSARGIVESKITTRSGSVYSAAMELIYPLVINNETKYVWFVPIYYQNAGTGLRGLAGLGIVDSQSPDKVAIVYTGDGLTGTELIHQTKEAFKALYFENVSYSSFEMINATLISMYDPYVKDGNTMRWIVVETELGLNEVLMDSDILSDEQLLEIQKLQNGDDFKLKVNDNIIEQVEV